MEYPNTTQRQKIAGAIKNIPPISDGSQGERMISALFYAESASLSLLLHPDHENAITHLPDDIVPLSTVVKGLTQAVLSAIDASGMLDLLAIPPIIFNSSAFREHMSARVGEWHKTFKLTPLCFSIAPSCSSATPSANLTRAAQWMAPMGLTMTVTHRVHMMRDWKLDTKDCRFFKAIRPPPVSLSLEPFLQGLEGGHSGATEEAVIAVAACRLRAVVAFAVNVAMVGGGGADSWLQQAAAAAAAAACCSGAASDALAAIVAHDRVCRSAQCSRRLYAAYWQWLERVYECALYGVTVADGAPPPRYGSGKDGTRALIENHVALAESLLRENQLDLVAVLQASGLIEQSGFKVMSDTGVRQALEALIWQLNAIMGPIPVVQQEKEGDDEQPISSGSGRTVRVPVRLDLNPSKKTYSSKNK